ncbi:hypothetical protein RR46_14473 [Papilio xuthus]|uniref:Uncharacterized protein n=1 Tax=Papilio xuthus TaxID=66420 RepID=A0A194PE51_PAPXU|nr:hypothetical protein RR46_14473 [Papilio xuthus]
MKTKQIKDESDKSVDEDTVEPKTRARKKASDVADEDKNKPNQDDKPPKEPKKTVGKPKAVVKKRPLGIRKTLRNKKIVAAKEKLRNVVKVPGKRGRKPAIKPIPETCQETVPLIPACEIKKEPIEDTTPNSRSSSPKTGRRQRLSSDMFMMKSVLGDSPNSLVLGPRTSPYSMRSERSNSPSMFEGKHLRSRKPRGAKSKLLSEVVMKEQKKRRRLLSDSKTTEGADGSDDSKKLKRGRSCSRDGSEFSKCSDVTESDVSLSETLIDTEHKELNKNIDKPKTDLDVDIENNVQISTIAKVPSLNTDSKLSDTTGDVEPSCNVQEKEKKKLSLKRTTSLDSDNNNSNRLKLDNLNTSELEAKLLPKTEQNTLLEERSSILTSMSRTFNSKEVSKNIRKARRGKKVAGVGRSSSGPASKNGINSTITNDPADDKHETLDTLSKEINDLINDLDQNIDQDQEIANKTDQMPSKPVAKFYGLSKPLGDSNSIVHPETPNKDKDLISPLTNEMTPSKSDDSDNIRLRYEDSVEKSADARRLEIPYNCPTVASIDKLMDRLKEFEERDKKRQRQESESKATDNKSVMVTNDVVLIPKSGADIKPLKDIQTVRSPEKVIEKENVLSCFENNSAISIVKRDQVRKSIDVDLPNSVTLIKRNSFSARKESTSSNHSKESDAISVFEKSFGKDVTLTELRKSVDKGSSSAQIDLHHFSLHPTNTNQALVGLVLDSSQISITPRVVEPKVTGDQKRKSSDSLSRKSSESGIENEEKITIEKMKSPTHQMKSQAITIIPAPVAVKSPETAQAIEAEALAPPLDNVKPVPASLSLASEVVNTAVLADPENKLANLDADINNHNETEKTEAATVPENETVVPDIPAKAEPPVEVKEEVKPNVEPVKPKETPIKAKESTAKVVEVKRSSNSRKSIENVIEAVKPKSPKVKSARNSIESQAGPSNMILETPESQERKESVLRTCYGLITHKAANEAKIEKAKEKERIYGSNYCSLMGSKNKSKSGDYTGTLKTVIKLPRNTGERERKRQKTSLKMTFQKTKPRSGKVAVEVGEASGEDHYTVERREGGAGATSDGGHRKSHYSNRLNHDTETVPEPEPAKDTPNLVIPEKASSFSIHPDRLCLDQCFYCGGKFGLFDTPCHIAQMKSTERQRKVLDNEEKLTIDSCLCDACYRHVDRRANCPSYRKRPLVKPLTPQLPTQPENVNENPLSPTEDDSSEETKLLREVRTATCHTAGCGAGAEHSVRRKWLIKMRSSVNKLLKLECDYPGLHTIPLCAEHYRTLAPLMACVLCRRRITKHHNVHFIHHGYLELNPYLKEAGVPVQFTERPVLCKMCRNYCALLTRPGHNDKYAQACRRRLLQIYNIELPPELEHEVENTLILEDSGLGKQKKKARTKSKQRKSSEPDKLDSESSERATESSPEKEKEKEVEEPKSTPPIEEDIESLISSNKIPVPGATKQPEEPPSDGSESEAVFDCDAPIIPLDKRTELQYLLQKQNNPKQFIQKPPNLTQKQKNILKVHNPGVQKPGYQNKINDKNSKRLHKIGQIFAHKDKPTGDVEMLEAERAKEITILKNISLNDECTIETIPNKKPADINTLKNKWQMSESFTQVKKNLSELSKKLSVDKEPKKSSDMKYSNPVKRLETNPSISVRELFPGEEEMNLQCNIEFNNVKGVTPEGWEKCNTMIQYDVETKKLWNELQRPYGNQSSFLRHLILLEKYFRNGDLVLSHNASPNATNYSDSVQSRLRSYDNVVEPPKRTEPAISLLEFRKKPSVNGKSLLKSSHSADDKDPKKFMPPPVVPKPKSKSEKSKLKPLPPELIAINTPNAQGRKAIQNVLHNIQQLVKGVSAADPTEVAAAPLPPTPKFEPPKEKKETLNKPDTPKKTKTTSKPWRPTLMPITQENLARIAREPTQVAVDGRTLPSLVQVMSSGKRYHITLQDYNKMCIMRREKLQQLQDGDCKPKKEDTTIVTEVQTSSMLGNGGTVMQNIPSEEEKKESDLQISANAANILKNVGLKNITIAPIPPKTATVTSQTLSPVVSSPSLLMTSTPIKIPQLGPAVSITSETVLTPTLPIMTTNMVLPKIPKSLTVIPQTVTQPLAIPVATLAPSVAVSTDQRP